MRFKNELFIKKRCIHNDEAKINLYIKQIRNKTIQNLKAV